jgi:hypothetical protein
MESLKYFQINDLEYELYLAASGDYCVTVTAYGQEPESYNLGSLERAYEFILSYVEVKGEE